MQGLLQELETTLGADGLTTGEAAKEQAYSPWARLGAPLAIVRPRSTQQVSAILKAVHAAGGSVVPWGGRTGLVDGGSADGAAALADGTVVTSMNRLIKNNTGYDLKQLFIGSEGTLGVVTRAVLRLRPKPMSQNTAFLAVDSFEALPKLLRHLESELAGSLAAFEVMWPEFYDFVTTEPAKGRAILPRGSAYYVLVEMLGAHPEADAERFEAVLAQTLDDGVVSDAVIAKSQAERDAIWGLRDDVSQPFRNGPAFTYDISLPISEMPDYVAKVRADL